VFHVDPPVGHPDHETYQPYWVAMCDQDDLVPDSCDSEEAAFERARGHCESVDPIIYRPLDPEYVAPPRGQAPWQMT